MELNIFTGRRALNEHRVISDGLNHVFTVVNYVVLCVSVSLFGIVANSMNVFIFYNQGFKENINISLFGLAISDLILQTMTLWICLCVNPWLEGELTPFKVGDVLYYIGGWIQVITTRVTGWITAFVTLERCLCIIIPFKVKEVLSTTRTKGVIVMIFILSTICVIPVFFTFSIEWVFEPRQNRSLLVMVPLESRRDIQNAVFYLNNVAFPLCSFAIVAVCTIALSISINQSSKWRCEVSSATDARESIKTRDQKLIKMVALIAVVFMICYTPTIVIFLWMVEDEDFNVTGRYRNLFLLISSFAFLFESVNSSLNIFIYYNMSTKYSTTFRSLFCKDDK